jgi:hypothetical protein
MIEIAKKEEETLVVDEEDSDAMARCVFRGLALIP